MQIQPTPNPNARKFILDSQIKTEGKSTFKTPLEAADIPLAKALFEIRGIDQVYFFQNVITITKFNFEAWEDIEKSMETCLEENIPGHNPDFEEEDPERERRANLSPELQKIENIVDDLIRPALQRDGGDLQCISIEDKVLTIKYIGACGTCPSSTSGTFQSILGNLRAEYDPDLQLKIEE